jgi:hypothetical protein
VPSFTLECFQNEYLAHGVDDVNAIVTMSACGTSSAADAGEAEPRPGAFIMMIDVSGSMNGEKIRQARKATIAAIQCVQDGARFAVLAGNQTSWPVYPPAGLAVATQETRREAAKMVERLTAGGGTKIGTWIAAGTSLLATETGVRHAILLTDGKNENETPEALQGALAEASGVYQCDCRGVGTDWVVAELRGIAAALLGTVDIVADPAGLTSDFEAIMRRASGKAVSDVALRVWVPQGAQITLIKQVAPDLFDLTAAGTASGPQSMDYPTGAWGEESRDYHLAVQVQPGAVGDEMLAARVSIIVDGQATSQALIKATWTDDATLSTRIDRRVAHYTGQEELADAVQEGLEARTNGDVDTAAVKLGRAVQLAAESGNREMSELLAKVVDVDDAATGRVRLKAQVAAADEMTLDTRSTKTVRVRK